MYQQQRQGTNQLYNSSDATSFLKVYAHSYDILN